MSRLLIVVEKASDWGSFYPSDNVVTAMEYLKQPIAAGQEERTQVVNLCRSYKYLGVGYYVSLLAEARGHRVIPSVRTINDLRRRSIYGLDIEDLNQKLTKFLPAEGRDTRGRPGVPATRLSETIEGHRRFAHRPQRARPSPHPGACAT